jgi:hypothetical protein
MALQDIRKYDTSHYPIICPTGYQEKQNIQPKGNKKYEWRESATSSDWSESNTCRKQQLEIRSWFVLAILSAKGKED